MKKIVANFENDFDPEPFSGCWIWTGRIGSNGYGYIGRSRLAHREFYNHYVGEIPVGMQLHHKCDTPLCVNPKHMTPIIPSDHPKITWSSKNQCRNGHTRTTENTYIRPDGTRLCRDCCRLTDRQRRIRNPRRKSL